MAMRRRTWLIGGTAAAAVLAGIARPADRGGAHDAYFTRLTTALKDLPAGC